MTFKRTDFLETFVTYIDLIIDMNTSFHLFNVCEDNSKPYATYLENFLKNNVTTTSKDDIAIIDISKINWLDLSTLPTLSIIDCSNLSNHNIGVISSQNRKLIDSQKSFLFNFSNKQHSDSILNSFEPFQLRTKTFYDLSKDLEKYNDFLELKSSVKNNNSSIKKNKI